MYLDKKSGQTSRGSILENGECSLLLLFSNVQNKFFFAEYILNNETDYQFLRSRKRQYNKDSILKMYLTGNQNEYDVNEKDKALVHIYFDNSSFIEYQRQVTMTW